MQTVHHSQVSKHTAKSKEQQQQPTYQHFIQNDPSRHVPEKNHLLIPTFVVNTQHFKLTFSISNGL